MKKNKSHTPAPLIFAFLRRAGMWLATHKVQVFVFFGAVLVLFFRRPDALLNAQFWAEDIVWFSDPINNGNFLITVFQPYAGYMTVAQHLVGWFASLFPLEIIPLVFNICAISIQALLLVYLWSKRTYFITPEMKVFLTFVYLAMPYVAEVHANVTNTQWYLGILLFLLLFVRESESRAVRWIDRFIMGVASLTGPFSILLSPVVALEVWRARKLSIRHAIVLYGAMIQLLMLLLTRQPQSETIIGYSVTTFFQIIGGQIFGAGLFGQESLGFFYSKPWMAPVLTVLGVQLMLYVFFKVRREFRYFMVYATLVFTAALLSSMGTPPGATWWYFFTNMGWGCRYYVMLHLALFMSLGWLVLTKTKIVFWLRAAAAVVLALSFVIGVPKDFMHTPYYDFDYKAKIREYRAAPPGRMTIIQANPGGDAWRAFLFKE